MSALDGWIDVCRAGTWRDLQGRDVRLDEDRLDRIVAAHAAADPAPVVVGHPETDAPAYAWIDGLRRVGDRLQARLRDIAPAFREAVEAGRYAGRSIALQGDTLRHLGFLGGRAPAVPGLAPTRFAAAPETVVAFAEDDPVVVDDSEAGSPDETAPSHPDPLRTQGPTADEDGTGLVPLSAPAGRGGDDDNAALAEREAALAAREAALCAREAAAAAGDRRREAEAALAPYVEAGRVLPAERAGLAALHAALREPHAGNEGTDGVVATIAFASPSGSEVRMQPAAILERFIEGLPRRVDYRTLAGGPVPGLAGAQEDTGEDSERIAAEARALMAAEAERGLALTPAEAVDQARAKRGLGAGGGTQ